MKSITTYLSICLISIISFTTNAQEQETSQAETLVKNENQYRKGQLKWLNSNDFNTSMYDWSDPTINLYVNQAVKRQSKAKWIGIVGGSILVLGLAANAMGSLAKSINDSNPDEPYQVMKGPYYLGGAMVVTSVVLSFDSMAKLNKAKKSREKKFK